MATVIKPLLNRKIGHVPFKSFLTRDDKKGQYLATSTHNGKEFVGIGPTEQIATQELRKKMEHAATTDALLQTRSTR